MGPICSATSLCKAASSPERQPDTATAQTAFRPLSFSRAPSVRRRAGECHAHPDLPGHQAAGADGHPHSMPMRPASAGWRAPLDVAGAEQDSRLLHDGVWPWSGAAKRLLGAEFDGVLVTDQYAGYRFIDADQRQLCWAHRAPQSRPSPRVATPSNQPIGARLVLLADAVFRYPAPLGKALSKQKICAGSRVTGKAGEGSWSAVYCCAANATVDDASYCCGMTRCCGGL